MTKAVARLGVIVLAIGCLFVFARVSSRPDRLYYKPFGDHIVKIWISADDAGASQQKIHGSYFRRYDLMIGYNSVNLPTTFTKPTFTTIHEPVDELICIYDNNGYGFLMIVDQADDDWYIGGMTIGARISPLDKWSRHYDTIRSKHPEVPYSHFLRKSQQEPDNKPIDPSGGSGHS
ncbi:MAG: hypothetical protein ACKN82_18690 [Pirellula sp.]